MRRRCQEGTLLQYPPNRRQYSLRFLCRIASQQGGRDLSTQHQGQGSICVRSFVAKIFGVDRRQHRHFFIIVPELLGWRAGMEGTGSWHTGAEVQLIL
jgi:hypothetical protein